MNPAGELLTWQVMKMSRLEEMKQKSNDEINYKDKVWLINRVEELNEKLEKEVNASYEMERRLSVEIERVEYLEALVNSQLNVIGLHEDKTHRYKQALEEIAQDTGTPYADIAIKALTGDNL